MESQSAGKYNYLIEYLASVQDSGRLTFTKTEAVQLLKLSSIAFNRAAERLVAKKQLIHPARGFFVIVPAEYRSAGAPPTSWFIEELMKFHRQPYYVGVLSAAALHGAAHQAPQEFQVMTTAPLSTIRAGRARIRFFTKTGLEQTPTQSIRTPYGNILVATPEATAFDLVRYVYNAGYFSNVATILIELSEKLDPKKLVAAAEACGKLPVAQRVGYLLDTFVTQQLTRDLYAWLEKHRFEFVALRPNWKLSELSFLPGNDKWKVIINETVEPDV